MRSADTHTPVRSNFDSVQSNPIRFVSIQRSHPLTHRFDTTLIRSVSIQSDPIGRLPFRSYYDSIRFDSIRFNPTTHRFDPTLILSVSIPIPSTDTHRFDPTLIQSNPIRSVSIRSHPSTHTHAVEQQRRRGKHTFWNGWCVSFPMLLTLMDTGSWSKLILGPVGVMRPLVLV